MGLYLKKIRKGSITTEGAIVLPIFLYGVIGVLWILQVFSTQITVHKALKDTANEISLLGYFEEDIKTIAGIQVDFYKNLKKENKKNTCISGGIISLLRSYYEEDDIVLIADYQIKIPVPLLNLKKISICQTVKTRKFIGWDRRKECEGTGGNYEEEQYVFITETGKVYHLHKSCSHLDLSIRGVLMKQIDFLRNDKGEIYHSCLICVKGIQYEREVTVFITDEGNRYHEDFYCSGLKRTIEKVPLQKVRDWRQCSRCGGV